LLGLEKNFEKKSDRGGNEGVVRDRADRSGGKNPGEAGFAADREPEVGQDGPPLRDASVVMRARRRLEIETAVGPRRPGRFRRTRWRILEQDEPAAGLEHPQRLAEQPDLALRLQMVQHEADQHRLAEPADQRQGRGVGVEEAVAPAGGQTPCDPAAWPPEGIDGKTGHVRTALQQGFPQMARAGAQIEQGRRPAKVAVDAALGHDVAGAPAQDAVDRPRCGGPALPAGGAVPAM